MAIVNFSGLASQVQWQDLIDQMMALERAPATRLQAKIDAAKLKAERWADFRTLVQTFRDSAFALQGDALRTNRVSTTVPPGSSNPLASVSASTSAAGGAHSVRVLALAANETLGGEVFASRTSALAISGEFRINGKRIEILASDSLEAIAQKLNDANAGGSLGVTASVLSTGANAHRLVLTSTKSGASGIDLVDGSDSVLRALGLVDNTVAIKTPTSNGAKSDIYGDAVTAVASLLGYSNPPTAADIVIGGVTVNVDTSTMSLTDIADAINTAAGLAGRGVSASVIDDVGGKRLDIKGATSFTDANRILESLGVLEAGRGSVAQQVTSSVLESGAGTPANAATALTSLWSGGVAAGVQANDTLKITGTRGDGSTFTIDFTINGGDTVQTLLDRLNSAVDGFKAGSRTATASIDANGQIVVTDDTGGNSRLALSIVANNEGGGSLDFGAFGVTQTGRARTITAGADAEVEINGSYLRSSTNSIVDAVPGLTLNLGAADPNTTVTVNVTRDTDATVAAVTKMIEAYNKLADFVDAQLTPPEEGKAPPPLYGDASLRSMRSSFRNALNIALDPTTTGGAARLPDIGIEINRNGRYTIDAAKLRDAAQSQPDALVRLFGVFGTTTANGLSYVSSSSKTVPGTYEVEITQAASFADVTGAGFGGTYVDDGTADLLNIRDLSANKTYSVSLTNGMMMAQIVDALNAQFAKPLEHIVKAGATLYSDAAGTNAANDSTTWGDLRLAGGANPNVANGDVITISGTRTDGSAFLTSVVIDTTATLGQLRQAVQSAIGSDVAVTWENGMLTATSKTPGSKTFTLAISSDNAGGGTLAFGGFTATQEGRGAAKITAENSGGQLRLVHGDAGSTNGFEISFTAGGADGAASLGLGAGTHAGTDVAGTIGGFAATGSGRILTGAAGTPIEGLLARYEGTTLGAIGSLTFSRGIGARLTLAGDALLGKDPGSIDDLLARIDGNVTSLESRIETIDARLEVRREELVRRFTAMEQAIARAQQQSAWLDAQFQRFRSQQ